MGNPRTKNAAIDTVIEKVLALSETMEKRLDAVDKKIDTAILPLGKPEVNLMMPSNDYGMQPLISAPINQLTQRETAIRKEGFNKGLEIGLYAGAALVLIGLARILR